MKKLLLNKRWFFVLCLLLAACAGAGQPGQVPQTAGTPAAGNGYGNTQPTQANVSLPTPTQAQPQAVANTPVPAAPATQAPQANQPPAPTTAAAPPTPTFTPAVPVTGVQMVITGDDLLDFNVADINGNLLGEVKDLVIEPNQMQANAAGGIGRITYVIIQTELNDDWLVPVPWQFVQIRPEWRALTLPVNVNQLMAAPAFHEDVWPASLANEWQASTTQFWQSPPQNPVPAVQQPPAASVVPISYIRASDLFDLDVIDARGLDLGEIKDIALDMSSSQPANGATAAQFSYLIIDRGDALGLGGDLIPIPWRLVPVTVNQQKVVLLNIQPQVLQGAPSFMDNARPDLYADPWRSDLARYWDNIR